MIIESRVSKGVVILKLRGRMRIGDETRAVRTQIDSLATARVPRILLDLGEVVQIDSSGVGELTRSFITVRSHGGQLKLLRLTRRLRELMGITKLLTVFEAFDDESEAVESFFRTGP